MQTSNLLELIETLSLGKKIHIGVLFFGNYGNEKSILPYERLIHVSPLCQHFKSTAKGYHRCYCCRNAAIRKGFLSKISFGGVCVNGIYEYTRPIVEDDNTVGIIYIGNVLPEDDRTLRLRMAEYGIDKSNIDTLENNMTERECERVANIIESYIRLLMVAYPKENKRIDSVVENLKNYLLANLEYSFNTERLAAKFHYNSKYLGRLFKKETGISLSEYVNVNRVERAKAYLSQGKDSVIEIAYKIGYENIAYFNRVFKKHVGVSPTKYRKSIQISEKLKQI